MEKKVFYQTPVNKVIEVLTQGVLCQSYGIEGHAGTIVYTDSYSYEGEDF